MSSFKIDDVQFTISASKRAFTARKGDRILAVWPDEWLGIGWGYSVYRAGILLSRSRAMYDSEETAARAAIDALIDLLTIMLTQA